MRRTDYQLGIYPKIKIPGTKRLFLEIQFGIIKRGIARPFKTPGLFAPCHPGRSRGRGKPTCLPDAPCPMPFPPCPKPLIANQNSIAPQIGVQEIISGACGRVHWVGQAPALKVKHSSNLLAWKQGPATSFLYFQGF